MFVTQELVRNKKDVNEHERLSNITLKHKSKQRNITYIDVVHFAVQDDMNVNEHFTVTVGERLSNLQSEGPLFYNKYCYSPSQVLIC